MTAQILRQTIGYADDCHEQLYRWKVVADGRTWFASQTLFYLREGGTHRTAMKVHCAHTGIELAPDTPLFRDILTAIHDRVWGIEQDPEPAQLPA